MSADFRGKLCAYEVDVPDDGAHYVISKSKCGLPYEDDTHNPDSPNFRHPFMPGDQSKPAAPTLGEEPPRCEKCQSGEPHEHPARPGEDLAALMSEGVRDESEVRETLGEVKP